MRFRVYLCFLNAVETLLAFLPSFILLSLLFEWVLEVRRDLMSNSKQEAVVPSLILQIICLSPTIHLMQAVCNLLLWAMCSSSSDLGFSWTSEKCFILDGCWGFPTCDIKTMTVFQWWVLLSSKQACGLGGFIVILSADYPYTHDLRSCTVNKK